MKSDGVIILLSLFGINLFGQINVDSLMLNATVCIEDSVRMESYITASREICHAHPDSGIHYARKAHEIASKINSRHGIASALDQEAFSFTVLGQVDSALLYFKDCASIYVELRNLTKAALTWENIGIQYIFLGEFNLAKEYLDKAKDYYVEIDTSQQYYTLLNYGLLYDFKGDYDIAFDYYRKVYKYARAQQNHYFMALANSNISVMYYYMGECDKTIEYGRKALVHCKDKKTRHSRANTYQNMALCFEDMGHIDSSIYYSQLGLTIRQEANDKWGQAMIHNNLGGLYSEERDYGLALFHLHRADSLKCQFEPREGIAGTPLALADLYVLMGRLAEAKRYLDRGLVLAEQVGIPEEIKLGLESAIKYYRAVSDYRHAFEYLRRYSTLKDSLLNIEKINSIEELEVKYESEKKEQENKLLEQKNELQQLRLTKQRDYMWGAVSGLLGVALIALLLWRRNREKDKHNRELLDKNESIDQLKREIDHRSKNQLNIALSLLSDHKKSEMLPETRQVLKDYEQRLLALSTLSQILSGDKLNGTVSLKEYLQIVIDSLAFNAPSDFESRLVVKSDIETIELPSEDALRIGLILTELLTNSLKHAFDGIADPTIEIQVKPISEKTLELCYTDNGTGQDASEKPLGEGLRLVDELSQQLQGVFSYTLSENGFHGTVHIPYPNGTAS